MWVIYIEDGSKTAYRMRDAATGKVAKFTDQMEAYAAADEAKARDRSIIVARPLFETKRGK
jgi:hypothetical protein